MKTFSVAACMTILLFSSPNNPKPRMLLAVSYTRLPQDKRALSLLLCCAQETRFAFTAVCWLAPGTKPAVVGPQDLLWQHLAFLFFEPGPEQRWCLPRPSRGLLGTWHACHSMTAENTWEPLCFPFFHSHSRPQFHTPREQLLPCESQPVAKWQQQMGTPPLGLVRVPRAICPAPFLGTELADPRVLKWEQPHFCKCF